MKAVLFLFILPCVAQQTPDPAFPDKERALGKQLAADVLKRGRPVESAEQIEYLRRTGDRLASQLPGTVWTFQAVIADSAEPMPFPGGIILVPDAFFGAARNDDEFAAMLAHSMGHIALRHGLRMPGPARGKPVVFLTIGFSLHAGPAETGLAVPPGYLSQQRTNELEADQFALNLTGRAGFDPRALRRYLQRTLPDDTTFSPLPPRENRLARLPAP